MLTKKWKQQARIQNPNIKTMYSNYHRTSFNNALLQVPAPCGGYLLQLLVRNSLPWVTMTEGWEEQPPHGWWEMPLNKYPRGTETAPHHVTRRRWAGPPRRGWGIVRGKRRQIPLWRSWRGGRPPRRRSGTPRWMIQPASLHDSLDPS